MEGKDKEKEEALIKEKLTKDKKKEEALVKGKKSKASKRKLPTTISKLDQKNLWKMKIKQKTVNKDKLWKIEKIMNHKCGKEKKKVTGLLIKWEGDAQLTWEKLSGINQTASGMVKEYLDSKKFKA